MSRGPGATIDFAKLAPFDWDYVHFFGPYTPEDLIHENLGFKWAGAQESDTRYYDGLNLVVFVKDKAVVCWFDHPRKRGELIPLIRSKGYSREQARFSVAKDPNRVAKDPNRPAVVLVPLVVE